MSIMVVKIIVLCLMLIITARAIVIPIFLGIKKNLGLKNYGETANGIIVAINEREDLDNMKQYSSSVQFEISGGEQIIVIDDDFKYTKPAVGAKVKISYNREDPMQFAVNIKSRILFEFFLLVLILIIMTGIVVFSFSTMS